MKTRKRKTRFRKVASIKARARKAKALKTRLLKVRAYRIPIDRHGYDKGGRYYGVGEKLWAVDDMDNGKILRAPSQKAAREKFVKETS